MDHNIDKKAQREILHVQWTFVALASPVGDSSAHAPMRIESEPCLCLNDADSEARYRVLLEPSPVGRGGYLWIIFDNLMDAHAARGHVVRLALVLGDVGEYWPGWVLAHSWNKVRLP